MGGRERALDRPESDPLSALKRRIDAIVAIPPETLTRDELVAGLVELGRIRWQLQAGYTVRKLAAMRRGLDV